MPSDKSRRDKADATAQKRAAQPKAVAEGTQQGQSERDRLLASDESGHKGRSSK